VIAFDFSPVESVIAIGSRGKITLSWLETSKWKQHIRCRQNQQVRGHQSGGAEALT
jgi:hypothetical protein